MGRRYATPAQEYIQSPIPVTAEALAQKHHTRKHIVQRMCTKEGWVEKRATFQRGVLIKSEKAVMERAVAAGTEQLEGELADLNALRLHMLRRLLPKPDTDPAASFYEALIVKPSQYAALTGAYVAVQKQMCLMRGVAGGEEIQGSLVVKVVPLNGARSPKPEEEEA